MNTTIKQWIATVSTAAVADSARPGDEFEVTATTSHEDRMHDRVMPDGLDWSHWLKSPAICFAHDYQQIPVAVGTGIRRQGDGWRLRGRWLQGDEFAARVRNAWQQGALRAASIGFRPVEWVKNAFGGTDFLKAEMLEVSLVPIPANPHALKSMSSDAVAALRALEQAALRHPLVIAKGETRRLGPPLLAPGVAGSREARLATVEGEGAPAALAHHWTALLAPHRGPAQAPPDGREPITVTKAEIDRQIRQGIANRLAVLRLELRHQAYSALREEEQRRRRTW